MTPNLQIIVGDCRTVLDQLPEASVHCCVTSPPYWGLRDYGVAGQIGLEQTPEEWVAEMVRVFAGVWRVLRDDGTLWLNLGDAYTAGSRGAKKECRKAFSSFRRDRMDVGGVKHKSAGGLGKKNVLGLPWKAAFALQEAGWILRSDIIWHKPNPMPESVTDRPTKSHEYIFLLTKSERYFYDAEAIKEPSSPNSHARRARARTTAHHPPGQRPHNGSAGVHPKAKHADPGVKQNSSFADAVWDLVPDRNKRTVWTVPTFSYPGAHYATFPPDLIKPCILAGCPVGGTVLDPFGGSGTTGQVAIELARHAVLIELNPEYAEQARHRCNVTPGLKL